MAVAALMKTLGEMTGSLEKIFSSKTYKKLVQMMNLHPEMEKLATNFLALMNLATNDKKLLDLLAQNGSIAAVQGIMGKWFCVEQCCEFVQFVRSWFSCV